MCCLRTHKELKKKKIETEREREIDLFIQMAFLLEPENSPLDSFSFTAFHFKDANIHRPGRKL